MTQKLVFPIIGIGASAGGIPALKEFFSKLPNDTGAAFVVIQHLDPGSKSLAAEILARETKMPVVQVTEGMEMEPDHVYAIPPNAYMTVHDHMLSLGPPEPSRGLRMPIDAFLWSLAKQHEDRAIAIILSGTGHEGTGGVQAVASHGGMVMAQSPASAEYAGMPESAIATGLVDIVCDVAEMPERLQQYISNPFIARPEAEQEAPQADDYEACIRSIIALLHTCTGYDFRGYKQGTVRRRIARRMGLLNITSIKAYLEFLREHQEETVALHQDLLIRVTTFFRDEAAFAALDSKVATPLIEQKSSDNRIRIWVPGCASGEEAFSLAMLVHEKLAVQHKHRVLQMFATDLDEAALAIGRDAVYPESALQQLSPERKNRFFVREGHNYRVRNELRECITFARQNLIGDPPFSKIDLISCRNLLIYLKPETQRKILGLFHFALRKDGYLFLGNSETISQHEAGFKAVDKKWRIFQREELAIPARLEFPMVATGIKSPQIAEIAAQESRVQLRLQQALQRELLREYAPAAILVDSHYRVVYFFGQTAPYLEQPAGAPTQELVNLVRPELRSKLREVLNEVSRQERAASSPPLCLSRSNTLIMTKIVARPYFDTNVPEPLLLVTFEDQPGSVAATTTGDAASASAGVSIVPQLEADLEAARAELRQSIEEQETVNEEMQAANEEVISINEELQSSNEELESSKEELQSMNEELSTLNSQLNLKIEELARSNEDLDNLLSSTDIATLFLDTEMRIGRFTPATNRLFNLISTDVGRPFSDIRQKFQGGDLLADARRVLQHLTPLEQEVMTEEGNWYLRRILPYRTRDHRIGGVVITFIDITNRKRSEQQAQLYATVVRDSNDANTIQSLDGKITAWNRGAEQMYGYREGEALEMNIRDLVPEAERDAMREVMQRIAAGEGMHTLETTRRTKDGRTLNVSLTITPLPDATGQVAAISTTERDITGQQRDEDALRLAMLQAESAAAAKTRFLATASHDLRQPLQSISLINGALRKTVADPETRHLLEKQNASLDDMGWLLDSLLDTVRLDSGGVEPKIDDVPVRPVLTRLYNEFSGQAADKGLVLGLTVNHELGVHSDSGLLAQLLTNLLSNAIRYTEQGEITLDCDRENSHLRFSVTDTGIGIPEAELESIFEEFHQLNPNPQDQRRGMGLGLAIVQRIARLLDTRIEVESEVGHGSRFSFTLPAADAPVIAAPVEQPSPAATTRAGNTILLLDDDPAVLDSLQMFLTLEGFAVTTGASPQDAYAALENFTPDIIVSDYHLSNPEPAVEVVRKARARTGQRIPAIIISGDTSVSLQGLDNARLKSKPVKSEELLALIDELLAANIAAAEGT